MQICGLRKSSKEGNAAGKMQNFDLIAPEHFAF